MLRLLLPPLVLLLSLSMVLKWQLIFIPLSRLDFILLCCRRHCFEPTSLLQM